MPTLYKGLWVATAGEAPTGSVGDYFGKHNMEVIADALETPSAVSASYATTASFASTVRSGSYAVTASWAAKVSASGIYGTPATASYAVTASYALSNAGVVASATSASFATTASYAATARSGSYALSSSFARSGSYAVTSSYSLKVPASGIVGNPDSSSYAATASIALYALNGAGGGGTTDLTMGSTPSPVADKVQLGAPFDYQPVVRAYVNGTTEGSSVSQLPLEKQFTYIVPGTYGDAALSSMPPYVVLGAYSVTAASLSTGLSSTKWGNAFSWTTNGTLAPGFNCAWNTGSSNTNGGYYTKVRFATTNAATASSTVQMVGNVRNYTGLNLNTFGTATGSLIGLHRQRGDTTWMAYLVGVPGGPFSASLGAYNQNALYEAHIYVRPEMDSVYFTLVNRTENTTNTATVAMPALAAGGSYNSLYPTVHSQTTALYVFGIYSENAREIL